MNDHVLLVYIHVHVDVLTNTQYVNVHLFDTHSMGPVPNDSPLTEPSHVHVCTVDMCTPPNMNTYLSICVHYNELLPG